MKIGFFSDLHTEFLKPDVLHRATPSFGGYGRETFARMLGDAYRVADVVIAAGDIGVGVDAIQFLKLAFPEQLVLALPGNHEHYAKEIHANLANLAEEALGSNIYFMHDGEVVEIDGVLFCGAMLWTDFGLLEPGVSPLASMTEADAVMSDFRKIRIIRSQSRSSERNNSELESLRAADTRDFHEQHVDAIFSAMQRAHVEGKPLVVATHHAPCAQSLMPGAKWNGDYLFEPTDPGYASHLDHLMKDDNAPRLWIHGHTHIAADYTVGNTRVLSNPKGYEQGIESGWQLGRMVELDI